MKRHITLLALAVLFVSNIHAQAPTLSFTQVATSFVRPVNIQFRDTRMFVVEQTGKIKIVKNGVVNSTAFLDITSRVQSSGNEQGLLGLAFEPNYETTGYFYVYYINGSGSGSTRVSRFRVSSTDPDIADATSEQIIFTVAQPYTNHNGGCILFGPDGYLYVALGDGGSAGDPLANGQNKNTFLAKILRLNVVGQTTYTVPATNPFVGQTNVKTEIWNYGVRNPWKYSFDKLTGDMWIADVGQDAWEEINFQPSSSTGGENYGWKCWEGNASYNSCSSTLTGDIKPIFVYPHSNATGGYSVTGGYVYRGSEFPSVYGKYIFCDYVSGNFWIITKNGTSYSSRIINSAKTSVASFGEDASGNLYCAAFGTTLGSGTIFKLNFTCPGSTNNINAQVTNEFCTTSNDGVLTLTNTNTGSFTYAWSNGATTQNIAGLNAGTYTVTVSEAQGCTYVKSFDVISNAYSSTITYNSGTLTSTGAGFYQWYINGTPISGANNQTYMPTAEGTYYCVVSESNGCSATSNSILLTPSGIDENIVSARVSISPNPAHDAIHIRIQNNEAIEMIQIFDMNGKLELEKIVDSNTSDINVDITSLTRGVHRIVLNRNKYQASFYKN